MNGEEALEKIADASPDLILMDVFMPYMSGLELSEALKNKPETKNMPGLGHVRWVGQDGNCVLAGIRFL